MMSNVVQRLSRMESPSWAIGSLLIDHAGHVCGIPCVGARLEAERPVRGCSCPSRHVMQFVHCYLSVSLHIYCWSPPNWTVRVMKAGTVSVLFLVISSVSSKEWCSPNIVE